ncbi:MAG: PIG-L family deacetylase [Bryobacterales bacterium]|nr:PIG-L family deacetylase [Acidobacteriota bacterium]MCB9383075.1 PIG-L family deacetylase [Bryobacterales bacterium]
MERRDFLSHSFAGGLAAAAPQAKGESAADGEDSTSYQVDTGIERRVKGKPHKGKMLAAIQPHCDDIPIYAGGTILKLIDEGYEGILITMSNDSMAGNLDSNIPQTQRGDATHGKIVEANERDTTEVAKRLGLKEAVFLNYPNHNMDAWPIVEMRARLIFLFRVYKIDTILVYDPSGLYERNPDHYVTARAAESAYWMSKSEWDYPEHFKAGLTPHGPNEAYYFSRGPQLVNRVVDTSDFIDKKVYANMANVTQGPSGDQGAALKRRLAAQGKRLPLLGNDDETANREYTKRFVLERDRIRGQQHGLQYGEYFHYVGGGGESSLQTYIRENAVSL